MRMAATSVLVLSTVGLAACGGGGAADGGGGSGGGTPDSGLQHGSGLGLPRLNAPATFETEEYFRSGALDPVNASSLYAAGGTGAGQTVAVIDTGIDTDHPQLAGRIHPASTNIVSELPAEVEDGWYHGTLVSGVIAAERDGSGVHGLAFDAQVMAIRADTPGTCPDACSFSQANLAKATDYAVAKGASVLNYSLGGSTGLTNAYRDAMANAAAAGNVLVLAAGNSAAASPGFPGHFAALPEAMGRAMVVGAVDASNNLASFSARAGTAKAAYLVAPGTNIVTTFPGGGNAIASGTSLATPVVSGAAAAVWDAAPSLTADQVVELLLTTATDLGAAGVDDVFGWGLLNLDAAVSPQGALTVPLANRVDGAAIAVGASSLSLGGALSGHRLPDSGLMMLDGYDRPYRLSLGSFARTEAASIDLDDVLDRRDEPSQRYSLPEHRLSLVAADMGGDRQRLRLSHAFADGTTVSAFLDESGGLGLSEADGWQGHDLVGGAAMARPFSSRAAGAGFALGHALGHGFSLEIAGGGTSGLNTDEDAVEAGTMTAGLSFQRRAGQRLAVRAGVLREGEAALGTSGEGFLALDGWQDTRFVELSVSERLGAHTELFGQAALGRTAGADASPANPVALDDFWSTSWAVGLRQSDIVNSGDRLTVSLSQPLRAENAAVTTELPTARTLGGDVIRERRHEQLTEAGREIDLEFGYRTPLGGDQQVGLNLILRHQPGHDAEAEPELLGTMTYRLQF